MCKVCECVGIVMKYTLGLPSRCCVTVSLRMRMHRIVLWTYPNLWLLLGRLATYESYCGCNLWAPYTFLRVINVFFYSL